MGSLLRFAASVCIAVLLCAGPAAAQAVKISQVFGGGGNPGAPYTRDYVELFNAGVSEVNLAGWSLQYAAAAGTTWQVTPLPGLIIEPGAYFLVQMSSVGTAGEPLPQPDHVAIPGISMSSSSGKVALVNSTAAISGACPSGVTMLSVVDLVGFGVSANCFEGAGPAPAPSNTTVILRSGDGCADSGQNADDFIVGPANPRNSAISRPACPGADLEVTIQSDATQFTIENPDTLALRIRNLGPDAAETVRLGVTLPVNAALVSSMPEAIPVDGLIEFAFGDLAPDEEAEVFIVLRPYTGTQLSISAAATSTTPDPKPGNSSVAAAWSIFDFTRARLFVGANDASGQIRSVDVDSGASKSIFYAQVSGLAADNENRRFYISDGANLTIIPWDTLTPIHVGVITGADGPVDGLAWHPSRRRLLGTTTSRLYEIDTQSAAAKLIRTFPAGDFGAIDYDVASNRLIAANNSTSTAGGLQGRGFYRIHPYDTELLFLFPFPERSPGVPETDIDAVAAGGGRFYGVTDQPEWIYRYQQSSSSFLAPLIQPYVAEHTEAGATFTSEFYQQSPGANLGVEIAAPASCQAIDGLPLSIQVRLKNFGPSFAVAPTLTVTLPAGAAFGGSVPSLLPIDGVLAWPLIGLGAGESVELTITLVPGTGPLHTVTASAASATHDALPLNNTAIRDIQTQPALPAAPAATALLSTVVGFNAVPNHADLVFAPGSDLGRVFRSPSGNRWLMSAITTATAATDQVLIRGGESTTIAAREGVTYLPPAGVAVGALRPVSAILDNGDFTFVTDLEPDPNFGQMVVKSIGGQFEIVAEQSGWNAAAGGSYDGALDSVTLQSDGRVSFSARIAGGSGLVQTFLSADGAEAIATAQTTIPTGQLAAPVALESFASGATELQLSWMNAAGDRWCTRGDLLGPVATDICLIVNNEVRIQEGFRVPGSAFTSNVSAIHATDMDPMSGAVYCRGSNVDGKDWVWRDGQILASTGAAIFAGSTELFSDTVFTRCFFLATGNTSGDVVVGGFTSAPNAQANEVIVLNGERVLLRENDPIDLNGNGVLDDDARIHGFREGLAFLSDDGWFYAVVRVRSSASVCLGSAIEIGQALIRVRAVVACPADFNRDGAIGVPDIFAFLSAWFAQQAASDFDADGAIGVPDIFAFLSAWFAGCG
jgi:hypothetical protein